MTASIFGRSDNIKFWLDKFPDWDLERKNKLVGGVALGQAVYMGPNRLELVKVLLNHGSSVKHISDGGSSILTALCSSEDADPEILQFLLEKVEKRTPLVNFKIRGRTLKWRNIHRLARVLTRNNFTNSGLMTALAQDSGSTALHYAVQRGDVDVVNLLLRHGADPTIKNDLGKTPVDYTDAFPELRGALKRVIQRRGEIKSVTINRRGSTAIDMKFPMYLVPLNQLQRLYGGKEPRHERIEAHQELKRKGELIRWEDLPIDAHIIFFSHEWVGWNHPDPHGIQLKTFLRVMKRLQSGEISQVAINYFHAMVYKTNCVVRAEEWKEILSTVYVWIDWASMPQPSVCLPGVPKEEKKSMETNLGNAMKSIAAYVAFSLLFLSFRSIYKPTFENRYIEKSDFVTIVAPGCLHADRRDLQSKLRSKTCYRTYRGRGWCVLEVFAAYFSRDKQYPSLLITSKEGNPEWVSALDILNLAVGTSDFTCCQRNHIFGERVVPCDRGITRKILEGMIEVKVDHLFKLKHTLRARLCSCFANWWLRTTSTPEENDSGSLASFKTFLRWDEEHEEEWADKNEIPILNYAVVWNDIDVVREILKSEFCTKSSLNDPLFEKGVVEFGIPAKLTILHCAMSFASVQIVNMLLEKGANPFATDINGVDSLMFACASGQVQNVEFWISKFQDWDVNRGNTLNGSTALHASVYFGRNKIKTVQALLNSSRVKLDILSDSGAAVLSNAVSSVDSNVDVVRYLLGMSLKYGINYRRKAKTTKWKLIYGLARVLSQTGIATSGLFTGLALESGSTALQWAVRKGDVEIVELLMAHGSKPFIKNDLGKDPFSYVHLCFFSHTHSFTYLHAQSYAYILKKVLQIISGTQERN